ncbi:hypothetical protein [Deinococcus sp. 23YEL01]|uniref:hypothetical protein n=1 Tax=Deinococcus sp. 23YEL01 TaxID=2745871 RepID=UPI001E326A78|nr:hypothetical protein [Deinococcus sp. 23YEL01]MCD0170909.1 hypothetical protein [Deinococcus sp. 23YEL01]
MKNPWPFRLALALIGLIGLLAILYVSSEHMEQTALAWTKGGTVFAFSTGLLWLLNELGKDRQ